MISTKKSRMTALISTIEPIDGGVPTMTRWICTLLEELDITPILAWYAPWRNYPHFSVPSYKILFGERPKVFQETSFDRYESYGIGAWLPELEFTHYLPSIIWDKLISRCNLHLSVSGNALCALPYLRAQTPFLAWIATPWEADRKDRIREFILPRRFLDTAINTPILRRLERKILKSTKGQIMCLSQYTSKELEKISMKRMSGVMYMPVNTKLFLPDYSRTKAWRIGFSGRYCDPRKNIGLLLGAVRTLINRGHSVELMLVGDRKAEQITPLIQKFGLGQNVTCYMHMVPSELAQLLQTLDVFAIPSQQEGLCIAALEAMACGVPVISTRCGGPEDYVQPGVTGELVDQSVEALALMIESLCTNREKRYQLSLGAIKWVHKNASNDVARSVFRQHLTRFATERGYKIG